jgi:crotonobetainyl-CoA:carnitine CoA-transferase CaiB-like acyl-CoA transferase
LLENFGAGVLDGLGLGYDAMQEINPGLVYCALKGFLSGPYEQRAALDEVVQMMGGLAYMTGPEGRPLRAGASVNDVMGGLFGVIAIQAALLERQRTGKGTFVRSGLFENNVFLVAQHMIQYRQTGVPAAPMPERISAWAVYDVFDTSDNEKIFVGLVSDKQWTQFCNAFSLSDLFYKKEFRTNAERVLCRDAFIPRIRQMFLGQELSQVTEICERIGVPFAPILRPDQLFDDPHVNYPGATVEITLSNGIRAKVPALPVEYDGFRPGLHRDLPQIGEHNEDVANELGYSDEKLKSLRPFLGTSEINQPE